MIPNTNANQDFLDSKTKNYALCQVFKDRDSRIKIHKSDTFACVFWPLNPLKGNIHVFL